MLFLNSVCLDSVFTGANTFIPNVLICFTWANLFTSDVQVCKPCRHHGNPRSPLNQINTARQCVTARFCYDTTLISYRVCSYVPVFIKCKIYILWHDRISGFVITLRLKYAPPSRNVKSCLWISLLKILEKIFLKIYRLF